VLVRTIIDLTPTEARRIGHDLSWQAGRIEQSAIYAALDARDFDGAVEAFEARFGETA
jgi:hypothetical protein